VLFKRILKLVAYRFSLRLIAIANIANSLRVKRNLG
jgi:hypothetical protein